MNIQKGPNYNNKTPHKKVDLYLSRAMAQAKASMPKPSDVIIEPLEKYDVREQLAAKGMLYPLPVFIETLTLLEENKMLYRSSISKFFLNQEYITKLIIAHASPTDIESFQGNNLFREIASQTERLIGKYVLNASYFTNTFLSYEQQVLLEQHLLNAITRIPTYYSMHYFILTYFLALDDYLGEIETQQKETAKRLFEMTQL